MLLDVVSHSRFGAFAVKPRSTRSSCTGGPGFLPFLPRLDLPNALQQPLFEQIRHAVRRGHRLAGVGGLIEQQSVSGLGVVALRVEQRVGPVCLLQVGVDDRVGQPPVLRLAGDLQDPARHRDEDALGGKLTNERVNRDARNLFSDALTRTFSA